MKNLLVFSPSPSDATSLYRAYGPLYAMRRRMADLMITECAAADWHTLKSCDAVMLQRPANDAHVQVMNLARVNRKPVWVDYDDDLYAVPFSNPTWSIYGKQKSQNNVTSILAKADLVTVSTPALAAKFAAVLNALEEVEKPEPYWNLSTSKISILPNAYDTELLNRLDPERRPKINQKLLCWRGSATHQADLMTHSEAFCQAFGRHLDWTLNMVGSPFWGFVEAFDRIPGVKPTNNVITESLDPINYFEFLAAIAPSLMVVPLEDNAFNRAKSNIVWLEGIHAGAVTLAPEWQEWQRPGVITYKDTKDFGVKLHQFMSGAFDTDKLWREGASFVLEHLTLPRVNCLREALLRGLMEKSL